MATKIEVNKIGIGTTTPGAALDVVGTTRTTGDRYFSHLDWEYIGTTIANDGTYYSPWIFLFEYTSDSGGNLFVDIDVSINADPNFAYFGVYKLCISRHTSIGNTIRGVYVRHLGGRDNMIYTFNADRRVYIRAAALWGDGIYYRINAWAVSGTGASIPGTQIGRDANVPNYNGSNILLGQGYLYNTTSGGIGSPTDHSSTLP